MRRTGQLRVSLGGSCPVHDLGTTSVCVGIQWLTVRVVDPFPIHEAEALIAQIHRIGARRGESEHNEGLRVEPGQESDQNEHRPSG
jgi:hypothetical protein